MRRRTFLATAVSTAGLAGCAGSDRASSPTATETDAIPTISVQSTPFNLEPDPTSTETPTRQPLKAEVDVQQRKQHAQTVKYDTLFRDIEQYRGETVYYKYASVYQVIYGESYDYLQMNVSTSSDRWQGDIAAYWLGDERLLEDDYMEIWGLVRGLYEYQTVQGNYRTIPSVQLIDYNLYETES